MPLDWATTQTSLGLALLRQGAREAGTARLEEAVAAYRAALEEFTRERVPREWADVQRNLIRAYRALNDWAKAKAISRELRAAIKIMNSPLPTPTP